MAGVARSCAAAGARHGRLARAAWVCGNGGDCAAAADAVAGEQRRVGARAACGCSSGGVVSIVINGGQRRRRWQQGGSVQRAVLNHLREMSHTVVFCKRAVWVAFGYFLERLVCANAAGEHSTYTRPRTCFPATSRAPGRAPRERQQPALHRRRRRAYLHTRRQSRNQHVHLPCAGELEGKHFACLGSLCHVFCPWRKPDDDDFRGGKNLRAASTTVCTVTVKAAPSRGKIAVASYAARLLPKDGCFKSLEPSHQPH